MRSAVLAADECCESWRSAFAAIPGRGSSRAASGGGPGTTGRSRSAQGQTNSQPRTVANMLRLLEVGPGQRVLDVGSGSGWTTALLAHLVGPTGSVLGVELEPSLVTFGSDNLAATGQPWASIRAADPGVLGVPDHAPYDRILVSAEPATLPRALVDQLADGGRLVIPVRGTMTLVTSEGDETYRDPPRLLPVRAAPVTRTVGAFVVHPLVDVAGALDTTNREAFPGRERRRSGLRRARSTRPCSDPDDAWVLPFRAFVVVAPDDTITVVDLGVGTASSPAASWAPGPGRLPEGLVGARRRTRPTSTPSC